MYRGKNIIIGGTNDMLKKCWEKIKFRENGITLIALVITIVLNCVCHEKFCKNFVTA